MFESKMLVIAGVEMAVLLLVLCAALLFYIRGLRRLVTALEGKIVDLRETVKTVRGETVVAQRELSDLRDLNARPGDYGRCLDEQIIATREYYRTLDPDRDIALATESDSTPERRMVSLRHELLNVERESWRVEEACLDWSLYENKLGRVIRLYETPALALVDTAGDADEPESGAYYRALYLDVTRKWRELGAQAQSQHADLLQQGLALGGGDEFAELLERYAEAWSQLGEGLHFAGEEGEVAASGVEVGVRVVANQQEILRLRNKAVDQHRLITQLRQQLEQAQSVEQKEQLIAELRDQLERHQRFLDEYELCSRQLEDELGRLFEENQTLRQALESGEGAGDSEEMDRLKHLIDEFTRQSCDMLSAVETLEKENSRLRDRLRDGPVDLSGRDETVIG